MHKLSQRQKLNQVKLKDNKNLSLEESISIVKETATAKFVETVETHINLNLSSKHVNQRFCGTITLPYYRGKSTKVAVLTTEKNILEAKKAGADIVGTEDLINQISQGKINFDLLISTPDMIPKLAKFGRLLGPKGLMPSLRSGTLTTQLTETILSFKKGKFEYKADKTNNIHVSFGKSNSPDIHLLENLKALCKSVKQNKPIGIKGKFFKTIYICTTMGPSIKLDLNIFN
jgi:large subunit ribosomal protein L1